MCAVEGLCSAGDIIDPAGEDEDVVSEDECFGVWDLSHDYEPGSHY